MTSSLALLWSTVRLHGLCCDCQVLALQAWESSPWGTVAWYPACDVADGWLYVTPMRRLDEASGSYAPADFAFSSQSFLDSIAGAQTSPAIVSH